ncbi:endogenous retrovirus group K member 5 Gag polyprotein-like [Prinia subflava]|uniref:endogenous retrovirus group K member 5 Gag polyprotein-like n=1 Tax=Prinia subflava TaxID=208062 RepID=UPI002FE24755
MQEQENDSSSEEETYPLDPSQTDSERQPDLLPLDPRDPPILFKSRDSPKNNLKLTDWADIRRKAIKEGDFGLAHEQLLVMPVRYGRENANLRWEPMTYDEIKNLRKAVKESGLGSPYFKQLLEAIYGNYDLTPYDCRYVSSVILTEWQYVLWDVKWRSLLNELIEKYAGGPNAALTIIHLAGDPPHEKAEDQAAGLPRAVLTDIKDAAQEALLQVQPIGSPEGIYTKIRQGTSEPFTTFVDRLTQAIERQCKDVLAHPLLLRILAFANANDECKQSIQALPDIEPTLPQMIEACSKIGSPRHIATIQANILGERLERAFVALAEVMDQRLVKTLAALNLVLQQNNSMAVLQAETVKGSCYRCGKPGHVINNCPEPMGSTKPPNCCLSCKKGRHYANQCRSKFDVDGKPLSGNSKKSAQRHRATTQIATTQQPGIFPGQNI